MQAKLSDLKDFALIIVGFVLFVAPMIAVVVEGIRCATLK
jgi:uncharacterized membrane protein